MKVKMLIVWLVWEWIKWFMMDNHLKFEKFIIKVVTLIKFSNLNISKDKNSSTFYIKETGKLTELKQIFTYILHNNWQTTYEYVLNYLELMQVDDHFQECVWNVCVIKRIPDACAATHIIVNLSFTHIICIF